MPCRQRERGTKVSLGWRERGRERERKKERERERDANGALNSCALQKSCNLARGDPRTSLAPK